MEIRPFIPSEHLPKMTELMRAHWQETEPDVSDAEPMPIAASYSAMEKAGYVVAYGAFEENEMVGYCVVFVVPHLHYGMLYGAHDVLFIRKDKRKGTLGLRLRRTVKDECKRRGARFIVWHAKPQSTFAKLLIADGCKVEEIVHREEL